MSLPGEFAKDLLAELQSGPLARTWRGTSGLDRALHDAVAALAGHECAHLVAGGLAVQEHGCFRVTLDVNLIVGDVLDAVECLTADLSGPFERVGGCEDSVRDKRNGVVVNFLPGDHVLKAGCRVPFPLPLQVSDQPRFITLEKLVTLKLDSWARSPNRRLKDKADVI